MKVGIREAARIIGVSLDTLRRWEKAGKIKSDRTEGGHRRYDLVQLRSHVARRLPEAATQLTLAFVSASDPAVLNRQAQRLSAYCDRQGWTFELVKDAAASFDKKPVQTLIKHVSSGAVARVILPDNDSFHCLGPDLLLPLCAQFHVEIVIANLPE